MRNDAYAWLDAKDRNDWNPLLRAASNGRIRVILQLCLAAE